MNPSELSRRAFLTAAGGAVLSAQSGPEIRVFHDDGGWCWFEDERAIVVGNQIVFGTVASGWRDQTRRGRIEVTSYNWRNGQRQTFPLETPKEGDDPQQWLDDHNSPALLERPDGKILALYARHGTRNQIHYRISASRGSADRWGPGKIFVPSPASRVTYSNPFYLSKEKRIYNFYRGYENSFKPSVIWSDDLGETWKAGGVVIDVPLAFRHRPYVKYCSDGVDTIHLAYTEGHPRNFNNSVYHVFYRDGRLHRSDGTVIRKLDEGLKAPEEGTRIFQGDENNVAWTTDFHITPSGELLLLYTVQKDSGSLPDREHGKDHRFRLARWSGGRWQDQEIAYAGSRLYPAEADYTGLGAVDPFDASTVFISTNADPARGSALPRRELFRGRSKPGGGFDWTAVTKDSAADNLRPIIPIWKERRALLWLRGTLRTYTDYDLEVVGFVESR